MHWLPLACQHCENAPCVKVCPVQATYHRGDGIVMQDNDRCIGCRYCMIACPYGVRNFNWGAPARPTPHETGMVAARPLGTVEKCTMCVQRLAEDQVPSCVWSCPTGARVFGDLNDPNGRLATLIREREGDDAAGGVRHPAVGRATCRRAGGARCERRPSPRRRARPRPAPATGAPAGAAAPGSPGSPCCWS